MIEGQRDSEAGEIDKGEEEEKRDSMTQEERAEKRKKKLFHIFGLAVLWVFIATFLWGVGSPREFYSQLYTRCHP